VRLDSSKGKDIEGLSPAKLGPNASARSNTVNDFSYKPEELLAKAKDCHLYPVRLD